jgi:hypothetical protein
MRFEVEIKYGRHWCYKGIYRASNSRSAALHASHVHDRKVIRVRPEDSRDKWFVYRFMYVASLAAGV